MKKLEVKKHNDRYGVWFDDYWRIPPIYDSVKLYDEFVKVGFLNAYSLYDYAEFLIFSDLYEEIFIYKKYIACKQQYEGDWIIFDKSGAYIKLEYDTIVCEEGFIKLTKDGESKIIDQVA